MMISCVLKKKSFGFTITLFFLSLVLFSQENQLLSKNISGKVIYLNAPLENVNIVILDTKTGTKTNSQGNYNIETKVGDILQYSYIGFNTVSILVEDITTTLNIEMTQKVNELDEAVVTAKRRRYIMTETEKNRGKPFKTAIGIISPENFPSKVTYFDERDNLGRYASFTEAWNNMYAYTGRSLPGIWDVDGSIYYNEPYINLSRIKDIHVVPGTMLWGGKGVVIVRTYDSPEEILKRKEAKAEQYRNQNYYNEEVVAANNKSTFYSRNLNKSISGKVTHINAPLVNVNIIIKGTSKDTKTNTKGEYIIKAKVGDILEYSHVSFKTVAIMIEDVTTTLNIEMTLKVNELDEALVTARKKPSKVSELEKKLDVELKTPFGTFNPKKSGFAISYLDGKTLNLASPSIADAIGGKFAGVRTISGQLFIRETPAKYVIDGVESGFASQLNLSSIEDVHIVKNKALVIIRTKNSFDVLEEKRKEVTEQYTNQNYYNDDAMVANNESSFSSSNDRTDQYNYIITKNISGKVTYLDAPMPLVNIVVIGKTTGSKTNTNGEYKIKANVGDIIQYSHLGFATVSIIIEDVTEILDIEMVLKVNKLDKVTVTADGNIGIVLERAKKAEEKFVTSRGTINPKNATYPISFIDGDDIKPIYSSLIQALNGKMAGVSIDRNTGKIMVKPIASMNTPIFAIWDVDGQIFTEENLH